MWKFELCTYFSQQSAKCKFTLLKNIFLYSLLVWRFLIDFRRQLNFSRQFFFRVPVIIFAHNFWQTKANDSFREFAQNAGPPPNYTSFVEFFCWLESSVSENRFWATIFSGGCLQEAVVYKLFKRWCYTRRFATTTYSTTQPGNIVATLFWIVTTLFQHCTAVLR